MDDPRHLDPNREWNPVIDHKGEIVTYEPVLQNDVEKEIWARMERLNRYTKLQVLQARQIIPLTSPHQPTDQGEE